MKAISVILLIALYAAFSCFAMTGFAATKCYYGTCKTAVAFDKATGEIAADNSNDNCLHHPAVTTLNVHKQTNTTDGSGNKYLNLNSITFYKYNSSAELLRSSKLDANNTAATTCPLFIKHCMLLI
jgi:hypothetical protein